MTKVRTPLTTTGPLVRGSLWHSQPERLALAYSRLQHRLSPQADPASRHAGQGSHPLPCSHGRSGPGRREVAQMFFGDYPAVRTPSGPCRSSQRRPVRKFVRRCLG